MRAFFLALITLLMLPLAALAQSADRPNTILVLDGSGSMWGQIDGVNKIVIAREVIADLLSEMADDVSLGLTVYGHRQRGSCTDIETIVPPAPGTQAQILAAVNAINPRGRTPMTDAVIAAAQSLRSTEEAATVILVSDGIENCNPDPCAIAAELEASGVDFTAHVIGFDVASEPEARAQMQCIADNTGGQFLTADNAAELSAALEQVVAVMPTPMRIEAQVLPQGNLPTRPVTWTLLGADGDVVSQGTPGPAIDVGLFPGTYIAQATRQEPNGPQTYQTSFTVLEGQTDLIIVAMPPIIETSQITFTARVEPDMSVPASALAWTLYDTAGTTLLGPVVAPGGNVALLPGDYRLEVERANTGTRHEARFTVEPNTPQEVIVPLPALSVEITFTARIGGVDGPVITDPVIWDIEPLSTNPATANPAAFLMTRGAYRATAYWTAQEIEQSVDFVVVDQPREITVIFDEPIPQATVTAAASAVAGSTIDVGWTGPEERNDFIAIRAPDATGFHRFANTAVVSDGNPVRLLMPTYPGTYVIEYIRNDGRTPLASQTIEITEVLASVTAAATGTAGATIDVGWTGPNYRNDFIGIRTPDAEGFHRFANTSDLDDNPSRLVLPSEPGTYLIEYIINQDRRPLASTTIEVTDVSATLTAPASAQAGETIEVGFTGPEYRNDFIAIRTPDSEGYHRFANTVAVDRGNPARLVMPSEPGSYVIEYIEAQDRTPLASVPITISAVAATVTAPATAPAGATIEVGFTGPGYNNDFIAIRTPDSEGYHRFANTIAVDRGNPAQLLMPSEPGTYVIEYIEAQDRTALAVSQITVTPVAATLTAPTTAQAGATLDIGWTGPDYRTDFIAIRTPDSEGYHRFAETVRTDRGNPARLQMPTEPGVYVIEYIEGQDRTALAAVNITLSETASTLTAPTSAVAGATIEVAWTGPNYPRDFIGIGRVGAEGSNRWENFTRTDEGPILRLVTPPEPGDYVIRYFLDQDRVAIAEVPISLTAAASSVTAPTTAVAGSTIEVAWTGPNYNRDFIGIGPVGATGSNQWQNYVRTDEGSPLMLQTPPLPGDYLIRYFVDQDRVVQAEAAITLTAPAASITAPTTAPVGSTIELGWTGPDYSRDFIGIGRVGATGSNQWENYTRTDVGSPMRLVMPVEPGDYVIRYFIDQDRVAIAEVPMTLTDVAATLTAPATVAAGSTLQVQWTGPNYPRDFIGLGRVGATGSGQWETYERTDQGSVVTLDVPDTPGAYVLRYFIDQDRRAIAEVPVTVQ